MDLTHGKYLGIDYGDKRTGLSECDPGGTLASAISTISEGGMRNTAVRVVKEAESRGCKKIIIGLPKNMDGTEGFRAETVRAFGDILATLTDIPIDYYDERMSTMQASRYLNATDTRGQKRKQAIDTLSAQIILQSALDRLKNS